MGEDGGGVPVVRRTTARVVLVDPDGRTLLFRGVDAHRPQDGTWWFTPGGGIEDGEAPPDAARREVAEETGIRLGALGRPVDRREIRFVFEGVTYDQLEYYFVAAVERAEVDESGWSEVERRVVVEHRWWTADELRASTDAFFPADLPDLIASVRPGPAAGR